MRLFLALPVSDLAESALAAVQSKLKVGRLTLPEQFHVTLAFLGDVRPGEAEELDATLSAMVLPAVRIEIAGIGHFGRGKPRLVYAAVTPDAALTALQGKVAQAARRAGITVERRKFVPHVTLARLSGREEDAAAVASFAEGAGALRLPVEAPRHIVLYQSHLRPGGPVYDVLAEYPLG